MSAFARSVCRSGSKSLRQQVTGTGRSSVVGAARPIASQRLAKQSFNFCSRHSAAFSTMPVLQSSAAAPPSGKREFDKEIVDIASYVHSYNVNSDLAVCKMTQSVIVELRTAID